MNINTSLDKILAEYQVSFSNKVYNTQEQDSDILMQVYGITSALKQENSQYWGRELGSIWEKLIIEICKNHPKYKEKQKIGNDNPYDLIVGEYAIDAKYRIGSGDAGTLKKFKQYGLLLTEMGYTPVILLLREDSLSAALTACSNGGWTVYQGDETFDFISNLTNFNLKNYLMANKHQFLLNR